ncbi:MAG: PTS sorbitol transporter subunit IIA [Anaerolineaceae bacterium]|jgi:PTS system glucitol/sorbitol-specific IIA component|nr:MAG: PTS sorbitol transporter subunit IIA [Anaerolineaceae bacterium]
MIKYQGKIISIGPLVDEFKQAGILVFFGENAPEELVEFSIIHDASELVEPLEVGDTISLGEENFKVLSVGEVANTNLANLGHLIMKFNGEAEARLPGDVNVELKPVPDIKVGLEIRIVKNE